MALVMRSPDLISRDQFGDWLNRRQLGLVAVEIGTELGGFAKRLLDSWQGMRLVCVDPWAPYEEMEFDRESDYQHVVHLLGPYGDRVRIFRGTSEEAAKTESLFPWAIDFVYIDGDHRYLAIQRDIALWWPKLSPFGVLAGHDYCPRHSGVMRAVDEFADREGLTVYLTHERDYASWYVWKADWHLARARNSLTITKRLEDERAADQEQQHDDDQSAEV